MYGAITVYGAPFQSASTDYRLDNSLKGLPSLRVGPTTPSQHRRQAVPLRRFRLVPFRSPLLRESLLLSVPRGTEMFQFPRFPPSALCVQAGVTGHDPSRVSPFGHPRIKAWSAAPRGFSQPPTSFIGIWRQGIHRWLFVAWDNKSLLLKTRRIYIDARARYAVLKGRLRRRPDGARASRPLPGRRRLTASGGRRAGSARVDAGQGRRRLRLPQNGTVMRRSHRVPVVPSSRRHWGSGDSA